MKCVILAAFLLCSVVLALCSTDAVYEPEYESQEDVRSVRTKRSPHGFDPASLAFLSGVAAGGIFGPLLYNRLYGNQGGSSGGWSAPVVYSQGWEAPNIDEKKKVRLVTYGFLISTFGLLVIRTSIPNSIFY